MPQLTINRSRLNIGLGNLREKIRPKPLLKIAAELMRGSINKTFAEQGHPANSWAPLAPSTQKRRRNSSRRGTKILIDTGRLRNGITYEIGERSLRIGPSRDIPYGEVHQRGFRGTVQVRSHNRAVKPKRKKGVKLGGSAFRSAGGKGVGFVRAHSRKMNIPARPYLVIRNEDPARIRSGFQQYIEQQIRKEGL